MENLKIFILCRFAKKAWPHREFVNVARDVLLAMDEESEEALERLIFRLLPQETVSFPRKLKPDPKNKNVSGYMICGRVFEISETSARIIDDGWSYVSDDDIETEDEIEDYMIYKRQFINRRRGAFFGTLMLFIGKEKFKQIREKSVFPEKLDQVLNNALKSDYHLF